MEFVLGMSQKNIEVIEEEKNEEKFSVQNLSEESYRFIQKIGFGFVSPPICLFVLDRLLTDNSDVLRG